MIKYLLTLLNLVFFQQLNAQNTYAEKLGFPAGAKVLILHIDVTSHIKTEHTRA